MPGLDWSAIEQALVDWLHTETGLPVIWLDQTGPRLTTDFIGLSLAQGGSIGLPAERRQGDNPNPSGQGGDEVEIDIVQRLRLSLTIQAFTASVTGSACARAQLIKAQTAIEKPSRRAALRAAGLVLEDRGTVQNTSGLLQTRFEGRALLQMSFSATDLASEFTGYIATVNVTPNFS